MSFVTAVIIIMITASERGAPGSIFLLPHWAFSNPTSTPKKAAMSQLTLQREAQRGEGIRLGPTARGWQDEDSVRLQCGWVTSQARGDAPVRTGASVPSMSSGCRRLWPGRLRSSALLQAHNPPAKESNGLWSSSHAHPAPGMTSWT